MEIWIATSNQGKLNEIRSMLMAHPTAKSWVIKTYKDLPAFSPPPETGDSFLANARIKGKSFWSALNGQWVFAEDSGLVVDGLGGLPGIHSARYAGAHARDAENIAKLLKMMQIKPMKDRSAHFHCTAVVYDPSGVERVIEEDMFGEISRTPKGASGFGYDPVFVPKGETQTLAELGTAYKNLKSHRAQAVKKFLDIVLGAS